MHQICSSGQAGDDGSEGTPVFHMVCSNLISMVYGTAEYVISILLC
jgi:hypothetical protein